MSYHLWSKLFKSSVRQLELHQRNVREGVLVEEACDFARYLTNSGICDLMRAHPHKGENLHHTAALQDLFPYDGQSLYDQARALEMACCEYWQGATKDAPGTATGANKSDLAAIHHNLELIAGRLAKLESVNHAATPVVELRVVQKGEQNG